MGVERTRESDGLLPLGDPPVVRVPVGRGVVETSAGFTTLFDLTHWLIVCTNSFSRRLFISLFTFTRGYHVVAGKH